MRIANMTPYELVAIAYGVIILLIIIKVIILRRKKYIIVAASDQIIGSDDLQHNMIKVYSEGEDTLGLICQGLKQQEDPKTCNEVMMKVFHQVYQQMRNTRNIRYLLTHAFSKCNRETLKVLGGHRGGASMSATLVKRNYLYYGLVGNCHVCLIRHGLIVPLTEGQTYQTLAKQFYDEGRLTREEALSVMNQEDMTNYIGREVFLGVELIDEPIRLEDGDIIVSMSYEAYAKMEEPILREILSRSGGNPKKMSKLMVAYLRDDAREKPNNASMIVMAYRE